MNVKSFMAVYRDWTTESQRSTVAQLLRFMDSNISHLPAPMVEVDPTGLDIDTLALVWEHPDFYAVIEVHGRGDVIEWFVRDRVLNDIATTEDPTPPVIPNRVLAKFRTWLSRKES